MLLLPPEASANRTMHGVLGQKLTFFSICRVPPSSSKLQSPDSPSCFPSNAHHHQLATRPVVFCLPSDQHFSVSTPSSRSLRGAGGCRRKASRSPPHLRQGLDKVSDWPRPAANCFFGAGPLSTRRRWMHPSAPASARPGHRPPTTRKSRRCGRQAQFVPSSKLHSAAPRLPSAES